MEIDIDGKIRNSFMKVKKEVDLIKNQLRALEMKVNKVLEKISENREKDHFFGFSSGNEGVINNQQPSSTINNHHFRPVQAIKNEINERFKGLSDRELSIFLSIYTLEEELGKGVTLRDLSTKLNISEITIRGYINTLISKNIPIIKKRPFNRKLFLSINQEFRDLALISKLISIRNSQNSQ